MLQIIYKARSETNMYNGSDMQLKQDPKQICILVCKVLL
jgi:hypothetical protein